jgi:hypothetical protein
MSMKLTMLLAGAALLAPAAAEAGQIATLSGASTLTVFDADTRKSIRSVNVTGLSGKLAGIDVRPADGMLYGLVDDGALVIIDTTTGKATMKSKLETMLGKGVAAVAIDFNPMADRLRIIGADGANLRVNVDDGKVVVDKKLNYAEADANRGKTAMIVAGAYSNSYKGTQATALYDIDGKLGAMLRQAPPNDGVLNTMGQVGAKGQVAAFDIESDGNGGNVGWLIAGKTLHRVDIATGAATPVGAIKVKGVVRDLAVLPKM